MEERRNAKRFRVDFYVQYQQVTDDVKGSCPVTVSARDISSAGLSFYSTQKIQMSSELKLTFTLTEKEISFIGHIIRMEVSSFNSSDYIIGVKIDKISPEDKEEIEAFLLQIDIDRVVAKVSLTDVMDIHFVTGYPLIIKKFGRIRVLEGKHFHKSVLRNLAKNMMDEQGYNDFLKTKESNFVYSYKDKVRFRVNFHVQRGNVEGVFRLIPSNVQTLGGLGLPGSVERLADNKRGLILVAGRTGSGKTTTLSSLVEYLNNKRDGIIITIEKPIEYIHTNQKAIIKQREVGRDTLSFSSAAKNALRQNPDVLMIGEILDRETMEVAITAAETGILVLTSIHAGSSSQALDRVSSFFPGDLQKHILARLSLILSGVVTQVLIPRVDGQGFVLGSEVLVMNNALRRIVRDADWKQITSIIQTGRGEGMQSFKNSVEQHFLSGVISSEYFQEYIK